MLRNRFAIVAAWFCALTTALVAPLPGQTQTLDRHALAAGSIFNDGENVSPDELKALEKAWMTRLAKISGNKNPRKLPWTKIAPMLRSLARSHQGKIIGDRRHGILIRHASYDAIFLPLQDGSWRFEICGRAADRCMYELFLVWSKRKLGPGNRRLFLENTSAAKTVWRAFMDVMAARCRLVHGKALATMALDPYFPPILRHYLTQSFGQLLAAEIALTSADPESEMEMRLFGPGSFHETYFYRYNEVYGHDFNNFLEDLIGVRVRMHDYSLCFVSAGSSTGEEPYTIKDMIAKALAAYVEDPRHGITEQEKNAWLKQWVVHVIAVEPHLAAAFKAARGKYSDKQEHGRIPDGYILRQGTITVPEDVKRTLVHVPADITRASDRSMIFAKPVDGVFLSNVFYQLPSMAHREVLSGISDAFMKSDRTWFYQHKVHPAIVGTDRQDLANAAQDGGAELLAEIIMQPQRFSYRDRMRLLLEELEKMERGDTVFWDASVEMALRGPIDWDSYAVRYEVANRLLNILPEKFEFQQFHLLRLLLDLDKRPLAAEAIHPASLSRKESRTLIRNFMATMKAAVRELKRCFKYRFAHSASGLLFDQGHVDTPESIIDKMLHHHLFQAVSSALIPKAFAYRGIPTVAELKNIYTSFDWPFANRTAKDFGNAALFDVRGDYMAVLADKLLYEHSPEEMALWPEEQQMAAIWILGYNMGHIGLHRHSYELYEVYRPSGTPVGVRVRRRPRSDLLRVHTDPMTTGQLTGDFFSDRPITNRLLAYYSGHTPRGLPASRPVRIAVEKSFNTFIGAMPNWFAGTAHVLETQNKAMPGIRMMEGLGGEAHQALRTQVLIGLWKMSHMRFDVLSREWNHWHAEHKSKGWIKLARAIASFANTPWDQLEPYRLGMMPMALRPYSKEEKRLYSYLTRLTDGVPTDWEEWMTPQELEKGNQLIRNAFVVAGRYLADFSKASPVRWSKKDLEALQHRFPHLGWPGSYKLILMLYGWFGELFDVHAQERKDGSVSVRLHPKFGRGANMYARVLPEENFRHYREIKDYLDALSNKSLRTATVAGDPRAIEHSL